MLFLVTGFGRFFIDPERLCRNQLLQSPPLLFLAPARHRLILVHPVPPPSRRQSRLSRLRPDRQILDRRPETWFNKLSAKLQIEKLFTIPMSPMLRALYTTPQSCWVTKKQCSKPAMTLAAKRPGGGSP